VFAIIISEKGGAERRESFDRPEITVGRTQGNDLMLPKGNVSKRHAKLTLKDGHCIVTDLNSTNGTYVNRRRIAQPTTVSDGDRIYIGDFILRVEIAAAAPVRAVEAPSMDEAPRASGMARATLDAGQRGGGDEPGFSLPAVPPPPRLPTGTRDAVSVPARPARPQVPAVGPVRAEGGGTPPPRRTAPSSSEGRAPSYRSLLALLVERAVGSLGAAAERDDPEFRAKVTSAVGGALAALRSEGRLPPGVPVQRLVSDTERELLDVGPVSILWSDEGVSAVLATAFDRVVAVRGVELSSLDPPFSSEAALLRAIRRLCARAGAPLAEGEHVVERTLTGGVALTAVLPPVAVHGTVLVLRRAREASRRLDDLVQSGAASPAMGTFLAQCVAARANLLVVGPRDGSTAEVVGALALAVAGGQQIIIQRTMTLPAAPGATLLGASTGGSSEGRLVDVVARLPEVRLVVELAAPALTLGLVESVGAGVEGLVAVAYGAEIERTLGRLGGDLAAARPGLGIDAAREWLGAALDVAIEVGRGADGALRVRRIAEVTPSTTGSVGVEDLFRYHPDVDDATTGKPGSFAPTGVVPRLVERMKSRGIGVEPGVFQRAARR